MNNSTVRTSFSLPLSLPYSLSLLSFSFGFGPYTVMFKGYPWRAWGTIQDAGNPTQFKHMKGKDPAYCCPTTHPNHFGGLRGQRDSLGASRCFPTGSCDIG